MPTQVDWPRPRLESLPDGFVGERAAAADDADGAGLVDVAGHDADFALAGGDDAGAVGADERTGVALRDVSSRDHVVTGTPSVIATTTRMPASAASRMASARRRGGTKIMRGVGTGPSTASADGVKHRAVRSSFAALAGVMPPTISVP